MLIRYPKETLCIQDNSSYIKYYVYRLGVWDWHVHTAVFKIDNQQGPTVKKKKKL